MKLQIAFLCIVKALLPLPFVLLLAACSGETVTNRVIENNSDTDLKMVIFRNGIPGDTLHFSSGETIPLSVSTKDKGTDEEPDCVNRIDSAHTVVVGGGILTKKIEDSDNWESKTEEVKRLPSEYENTCVFSIQNGDIE